MGFTDAPAPGKKEIHTHILILLKLQNFKPFPILVAVFADGIYMYGQTVGQTNG